MTGALRHTFSSMGTVVTLEVVGHDDSPDARDAAVVRAAAWFTEIQRSCSRFDPDSELSRLTARAGEAVPVSDVLFEAIAFAVAVAAASDGAFDPTVGHRMERLGFDRDFRTGVPMRHDAPPDPGATWRDVLVDASNRTVTLHRPLVLDLGAVAKGLAIDLAARELAPFGDFVVDAGGDLYCGGHNAAGAPWSVGIRHPRDPDRMLRTLAVSDCAVCTSGDYERRSPRDPAVHHLLDPRTGDAVSTLASVTVLAPLAMPADALATAAFVLGAEAGPSFLESQGVEGLLVTTDLEQVMTPGFPRD